MKTVAELRALLRSLPKKRMYIAAGAIGALALVLLLIFRFIIYRSVSYSGVVEAAVKGEIEISRNAEGLPTVKAGDRQDAFFALGYLHAQDRLAQIEYYRAIARGALSEITDEGDLTLDRLSRIVGFKQEAESLLGKIGPPYRDYLDSYVRGINLVKERMYGEIIRFSDIPGDPWTAQDVLAIVLLSEWSHGYTCNRELAFPLPDRLGMYQLKDVIPEHLLFWYTDAEQKNVFILKELRKQLNNKINFSLSGFAAYVSRYHALDGRAKVFLNIDSSLAVYPLWYPVRIRLNNGLVEGVSMSGTPFILAGKNSSICFAGFSLRADTQEFYIETTRKEEGKEQYLGAAGWKDFTSLEETINVGREGRVKKVSFNVRTTDRGPVISDAFEGAYRTDTISIRSLPVSENFIAALFDVPMSDSINKARAAVLNLGCNPRVFLFSGEENVLKIYAGRVPVRAHGNTLFRKAPYLPPAVSVDLSAYQRIADTDIMIIGDSIAGDAPPPLRDLLLVDDSVRLERLRALVGRNVGIDVGYLKEIMGDNYSTSAFNYTPLFIRLLEKIPVTSARLARIYFHDWNYRMTAGSVPSTVFNAILAQLIRETLADELKNDLPDLLDNYELMARRFYEAFTGDSTPLFDDVTTPERMENRDMIFDRAFLKAMRMLNEQRGPIMEEWRWGTVHRGAYRVPLMREDSLLFRRHLKSESGPVEGGISTINRGGYSVKKPFAANTVTALSGMFDLTASYGGTGYGYSTNPFSEFYGNIRKVEIKNMEAPAKHVMRIIPLK